MQQALWVTVNKVDWRNVLRGSAAPFIKSTPEPAPMRLYNEKRGAPNPESDLSCSSQPDRASAMPSVGPVGASHADFIAALADHPPRSIPIDADAIDLQDRADHLGKVFVALSAYIAVIIDDTAQNSPSRLDLPDVEAQLADLAANVVGIIERAAEDMPWRIA